jgi:hypothetical protein
LSGVLEDTPIFEEMLISQSQSRSSSTSISNSTVSSSISSDVLKIDVDFDSQSIPPNQPRRNSDHHPSDLRLLEYTLEVAFSHFQKWPAPISDATFTLPFYGNTIKFTVPAVPPVITVLESMMFGNAETRLMM